MIAAAVQITPYCAATRHDRHPGCADVQAFVGHSAHVTRVQFSADGSTLMTVGGGDAIFVWEFCGDTAVDEAALVEASIEQAEAERQRILALEEDRDGPGITPAQALGAPSAEPAAVAAASVAAAVAAGVHDDAVQPVPDEAIEVLRARLRTLDTEGDADEPTPQPPEPPPPMQAAAQVNAP